jgi:hypothetical protein
MITLTEAVPAGALSLGLRTPKKANDSNDSVYQHREGEQEQIRSGEQLHHLKHVTQPMLKISFGL